MENSKISITVKLIGTPGKIVDGDDLDTHSRFEIVQITGGALPALESEQAESQSCGTAKLMRVHEVEDIIGADEVYAFKSMGVDVIRI